MVREAWLDDSIEKQEPQPLDAYDVVSDLTVDGKGIPWDMQDPSQEALESLNAEVKQRLLNVFRIAWPVFFIENWFGLCRSRCMVKEGYIRIASLTKKVVSSLKKMGSCTTVRSLLVIGAGK